MKSLTLLIAFFAFSLNAFSQASKSTAPTNDSTSFTWTTGMDELVVVKYLTNCEIDDVLLNKIIIKAMVDAKYSCKNKATYKPSEVFVYTKEEDENINVSVKFFASNAYGVPDKLTMIETFDVEGNAISKMTF